MVFCLKGHIEYFFNKHCIQYKLQSGKTIKLLKREKELVPRPVLGSRTALLGLGFSPLLLATSVLGGVSVGVPWFRERALRVFWDMESGCVFTPVHFKAVFTVLR